MTDTAAIVEQHARDTDRRLRWALALILMAQMMVVLDTTIANIALPYIGADLEMSQANLTWIVTAYALAFGGLLLLGGRLGDLYGRRKMFIAGLTIFALASLLGGVATSEALLLTARGLQGFGAALAAPAALALITTTFPAGPARSRAMAAYAGMSAAGAAIGLVLGGWLTGMDSAFGVDMEGWRLTFLINVPIGLIAAALAPRLLLESESQTGKLDIPGATTGTLGILGIVFGLGRASDVAYGWDHAQTITSLLAGSAVLVVFVVIETRVHDPLLPMRVFANRARATSFVAMLLAPAAMFAMFYFLSLFVQQIMGYSPLRAGIAFLPFAVGIVIGSGFAATLANRLDPRILAGTGSLLAAFALFMFSRLTADDSPQAVLQALADQRPIGAGVNYWTDLLPWLLLMPFGMGLLFVPLTLTAVHRLRFEDAGIGSGVFNTVQQVGGAIGLAALSTVALHSTNARATEVAGTLTQGLTSAGIDATSKVPGSDLTFLEAVTFQTTFIDGASDAFLAGTAMMLTASAVIWLFLNVRHTEVADTEVPQNSAHRG